MQWVFGGVFVLLTACGGSPVSRSAGAVNLTKIGETTDATPSGDTPDTAPGNIAGQMSRDSSATTTNRASVQFSGTFPAQTAQVTTAVFEVAKERRSVAVYRPSTAAKNPPLYILYHGTGGSGMGFISETDAQSAAEQSGFVVAAPDATTNRMGGPPDVDHWEVQSFPTGWNLSDKDPNLNDDVVLTRAIIEAAVAAYGVDPKRVYTFGFSNGAFFSPFVAFLLPTQIAAFAEQSGGAIRCANRGEYGQQWTGHSTTCEGLEREPNYPKCSGYLKPVEVPTGRVPWGYLVHYNDDSIVSVAWTCTLFRALGNNATSLILSSGGHVLVPDVLKKSWLALSKHATP